MLMSRVLVVNVRRHLNKRGDLESFVLDDSLMAVALKETCSSPVMADSEICRLGYTVFWCYGLSFIF